MKPFLSSRFYQYWLAVAAAVLLAACSQPLRELYPEDISQRTVPVYIIGHGWHAGIAIETAYIAPWLPSHTAMPSAKYLKFGWGDRRFYTDPDAGKFLMFIAATLPTESVLHVVGMDRPPQDYFIASDIIKVQVSEAGAREMAKFISARFKKDADGNIQPIANGLYSNSLFFAANGRYYLPKTSNTWTARALRKTGYPINPATAMHSSGVLRQVKKDGEVISRP